MNEFYVYLFHYKSGHFVAEAFCEEYKSDLFTPQPLFRCPVEWLPETREKFLAACAYYEVKVPDNVIWAGYVPF